MDRPTAIRKSLTAFGCGIAACVPFIGLLPAVVAVVISEQVIRRYHDWNPAAEYLKWSRLLVLLGLVISVLVAFIIAFGQVQSNYATGCPIGDDWI